jgi:hypothetical protein
LQKSKFLQYYFAKKKLNSMDNESQESNRQSLIELSDKIKFDKGISFAKQEELSGLSKNFLYNIRRGKEGSVKVKEIHIRQMLQAFPELDPDFKEENIVEAIKRIEQEKETLKDEIKELQAAVFKLQSKCK